jgi:DNA-binding NarL/FixJ family response regulator
LLAVRDLIAAGLSNKDIAARLRLSDRTAKVYVCDLYRVTGETRNRIIAGARQFYQDAAEGLPRMGAFE